MSQKGKEQPEQGIYFTVPRVEKNRRFVSNSEAKKKWGKENKKLEKL